MDILERIAKLRPTSPRSKANGRVVVVHWDSETIDYLVISPKSQHLSTDDMGRLPRADHVNPLQALAEHLREHSIQAQRLIVLLARPLLDQLTLTLPPAEAHELPALVAGEVEQQLGEGDEPPIVDYHVLTIPSPQEGASGSQVLAFVMAAADFDTLSVQSSEAGFRLIGVCSRELSPLGILQRRNIAPDTLAISVHLYGSEAELAICRGAEPIFLRLIRINIEDPQRVTDQIWLETQRCLTILPAEMADLPQGWFVYTSCETAWQVARALEDRGLAVHPVDPLIGWEVDGKTPKELSTLASEPAISAPASAANTGAAWEFSNGVLPVNLIAPKKAPVPPNPMLRWGALAAGAAAVVGLGVYFLLSDVGRLRTEVVSLENELKDTKQLTSKFQEKSDQVAFVENWLSDQVDWLAELSELSDRLPEGQNATVRRLTASASGNMAAIDLSVQVAQQENISELESRIRSAKYTATSKRISQNADSSEYPWQFETHIAFPVESPDPKAYLASGQTLQTSEQPAVESITPAEASLSAVDSQRSPE